MNNNSIGNILSRLSGIKSVSGRRVKPGSEFLHDLDQVDNDVQGINSGQSPMQNIPQEDMGGELTAQSYDVRANTFNDPDQDRNMFLKLGANLGGILKNQSKQAVPQTPPIETAQVDIQEGLPPVTASEQEAMPQQGWFDKFSEPVVKGLAGLKNLYNQGMDKGANFLKENFTPDLASGDFSKQFPEEAAKLPKLQSELARREAEKQEEIEKGQLSPQNVAVYGATDKFANQPELVLDFENYTGIPFDEEKKSMTEKYEGVLSALESGNEGRLTNLDEQSQRILQRITNNEANDSDKFYIGLALAMPLIIGGLFGKQAGLGALEGGAKGIASIYGKRKEENFKNEELLSDIAKQKGMIDVKKGELELEKLKIPEQILKNLPKDEKADLKGMNLVTITDPNTGDVVGYGPEILPDLIGDLSYANTPEKRKQLSKKAEKLAEEKTALERANVASENIINAAMQLKEPKLMAQIMAFSLGDDKDSATRKLIRKLAPEITIDGRKQNSAVYIDNQIEQLKDAYRRNEQMRAYTATVANHLGTMAENPLYNALDPQDLIDQMLSLRDRGIGFFVDRAESQGFLPGPIENKFGKMNKEIYKKLNRKEEVSELEKEKQALYGQ